MLGITMVFLMGLMMDTKMVYLLESTLKMVLVCWMG